MPGDGPDSAICRCGSTWLSESDREDLLVQMLMPASRLVTGVHAFDPVACHRVLSGLSVLELRALAVVLAQLVRLGDVSPQQLAVSRWRRGGAG